MTILTTLPASTSRGPCSTLDPCGWYLQVLAGAPGTCTYTSCNGVAVGQVGGRASLLPSKHSQHSKEPEEEELHCVECTVASAASGCGVPGCTLHLPGGAAPAPAGGRAVPGRRRGLRLLLPVHCCGQTLAGWLRAQVLLRSVGKRI